MAYVSRVSTLRIDDTATHLLFRTWQATATNQDTAEGGSVDITIIQSNAVGGPGQADTLTLNAYTASRALIKAFTLDPASANQVVTLWLTDTGDSGGAARHGTVYLDLRATLGGVGGYDVETDGNPNSTGAAHHAHTLDTGWIRGTTTLTESISNISAGGGKNEPASYTSAGGDSLFVRCTLGSASYTARSLTVQVSNGGPSGSTNSTTSATRDVTFSNVVDNRFPIELRTIGVTVTGPNDANTGASYTTFTSTTDGTIQVDPRLTIGMQAERDSTFTTDGNQPLYVISAHQLFSWARAMNARGEAVSGVTMTQRIRNGATTVVSDATRVTGGDGWTTVAADFTAAVAAPEGNRTHEAFPNAPADAVNLGTGSQTLGFSSAFTGDKAAAIGAPDELSPNSAVTITYEYLKSDGTRQALDSAPSIRIYSVNGSGAQVNDVAITPMTQFAGQDCYHYSWVPTTAGTYLVEVRAPFQGGIIEGVEPVTVRTSGTIPLSVGETS